MEPVETLVNSRVRRLAEYLEIDPKVAQELYYQSELWNSIDGLEHKARKEELGNLRSLRKALAKHSPKFEHQDVIQTTFRIDGFNLKKTLAHLEEQLELMVGFGEASDGCQSHGCGAGCHRYCAGYGLRRSTRHAAGTVRPACAASHRAGPCAASAYRATGGRVSGSCGKRLQPLTRYVWPFTPYVYIF